MMRYCISQLKLNSTNQQRYGSPKIKIFRPTGSILWPDLLRFRTFKVEEHSCMSGALHIQPNDVFNF